MSFYSPPVVKIEGLFDIEPDPLNPTSMHSYYFADSLKANDCFITGQQKSFGGLDFEYFFDLSLDLNGERVTLKRSARVLWVLKRVSSPDWVYGERAITYEEMLRFEMLCPS